MDVWVEQRVNIKFCVKLGKTATEHCSFYVMPTAMKLDLGRECLCGTGDLSWVGYRWRMTGRPSSSWNQDNVVCIRDMIRVDRTVTVRILADALHISKSTCHQILREDLGKRKLNARLVPHSLRINSNLCWFVTRGAEWCHVRQQYHCRGWIMVFPVQPSDQEVKHWMAVNGYSTVKESEPSTTKMMIMGFFFPRHQGYHHEFVLQGQMVNQEVYISVLRRMREAHWCHLPDLWASGQWTLLHDNVRPHTALSVKISH